MKINVDLLKDYRSDFSNEKSNFNSSSYGTFSSSYINRCSDSYIIRMKDELRKLYQDIEKAYKNIDSWWGDYNNDIESLERALSNDGRSGAIKASSVRSCVDALPTLKNYSLSFSGIINLNFEKAMPTLDLESHNLVFSNNIHDVSSNRTNVIDSFFSFLSDTGAVVSEGWNWFGDKALDSIEYINDIGHEYYNLFNDVLPWFQNAASTVWDVVESVGATITIFCQSLVEGILQFGEAIIDFAVLASVGISSFVTGLIDGGQAIYGAITGNEWSSVTKEMWEGTMGFVSNQYVTGWFDSLYQNTGYGKWLAENAWGFDTVRSVGSGIGYVAGVVVLTIATLGAGSAVAAGGSATASTAATTTHMAVTATVAGIGKGTQDTWANGAGLLEGLTAGIVTGLWEGLQFYLGGKINAFNGKLGKFTLIQDNGKISSNILKSLFKIGADSLDGGAEGIIQPLISGIYQDGYYDENGNYIEFNKNDNFWKRYAELFDDAGGLANVGIQTLIGGGSSLIGEVFDLSKILRESNDVKVEVTNEHTGLSSNIKEIDITETSAVEPVELAKVLDANAKGSIDFEANTNSMKHSILCGLDSDLSQVSQCRYLYLELNKRLHYSMDWIKGSLSQKHDIYNKTVSFDSLEGNSVICKGWSELYRELLIDAGMDEKKVSILGSTDKFGAHKWVRVDLDDGKVLIADATEAINHSIDLANCKAGFPTNGFVIVQKQYGDLRLSNVSFPELQQYNDLLTEIDKELGYVTERGYFAEVLQEFNSVFSNPKLADKLFDSNIYDSKLAKFLNMSIPKGMDGYESYAYFNKIKRIIFNESDWPNISIKLFYDSSGVKIEGVTYISVKDSLGNVKTMLYSMNDDLVQFNDIFEEDKWFNEHTIIGYKQYKQEVLQLKIDEFERLKNIRTSKEYLQFLESLNKGDAVLFNPDYENLDVRIAELEKEITVAKGMLEGTINTNDNNIDITEDLNITQPLEITQTLDTLTLDITRPLNANVNTLDDNQISEEMRAKILDDFKKMMRNGKRSNYELLEMLMEMAGKKGDEGFRILQAITRIKNIIPELEFSANAYEDDSWWTYDDINGVYKLQLKESYIDWEDYGTLAHELGHCLFDMISGAPLPENWDDMIVRAKINSSNNGTLALFKQEYDNLRSDILNQAYLKFKDSIMTKYGYTEKQYREFLTEQFKQISQDRAKLSQTLIDSGFTFEQAFKMTNEDIDIEKLVDDDIKRQIWDFEDQICRTQYGGYVALSDMIDAVFNGEWCDLYGMGHGSNYYLNGPKNFPLHELVANFTSLKLTNEDVALKQFKEIFGIEFYDYLDSIYNSFLEFGKKYGGV